MNTQKPLDEYAHLTWEEHPNNPDNYPDVANAHKEKPIDSYEVSYEYADDIGAEYMTESELEALGFDTDEQ